MIFLGRDLGGFQVEELGAIQPDALGPVPMTGLGLLGELDVSPQGDPRAVDGLGRKCLQRGESFRDRVDTFFEFPVLGQGLLVRIQDHLAVVSINDHHFTTGDIGQEVTEPDDGRDFQCPGQDRRVAGAAPHFGGKTENELPVKAGGFAGGEVVGEDDDRGRQVDQFLAALAEQVAKNPFLQVEDIDSPLGVVLVAEVLQFAGKTSQDTAAGVLG